MPPDDDPTVRLRPRAPAARRGTWMAGFGAAVLLALGLVVWTVRQEPAPPSIAPAPPAALPAPPAAQAPPIRSTAEIAAQRVQVPTAVRWAANPLVWVLDFPDLDSQGRALNRAAALIEKARTPRDRVLDDAALAAAIAADGRSPATWYYGHNYRASDLTRMFALARRDGIALNPLELWVETQVALAQALDRSRDAAFLAIPAVGGEVDDAMRAAILRHELAHGQFFTLPLFAAHVMRVWEQGFTAQERADMRRFLAADGYDTAQEEIMANEAMAYLLHTPDRRFFDPARDLGWSEAQADRLRALFAEGAPPDP